MKVLIIDRSGFTGSHLKSNLGTLNHEVHAFRRPIDAAELPLLQQTKFDVVVHLFAMNRSDAQLTVDTFSNHAGRIIVASSQDVYAAFGALYRKEEREPSNHPLSEDSPLRTSRYPRGGDSDKCEVEEVFRNASEKLPATILRLPIAYGPGDPRHYFFPSIKRMDEKRPAILLDPDFGNFKWTHGYIENIAHAFTLAVTDPKSSNRIYNIGESPSHKTLTIAERLHMLASAAKYRGKIIVLPKGICPPHLVQDLDFRHDLMIDDSAIRKELGYNEIVPIEEGLLRTVEWQRTLCPLQINPGDYNYAAEDALLAEYGLLPSSSKK